MTDIKFTKIPRSVNIFQEQRPLYILLHYLGSRGFLTESIDDLRLVVETEDSEAPCVVRRLANPNILAAIDRSASILW